MIMTNELKDRISKIRSGEVPEGYKKTKMGILPNDWNIVKLKDIAQHITKKNSEMKYTETLTNSAALGIINQTDYFEKQISNNNNIDGYYVVEEGDYAYNPRISVSAPCGPISKSHISETGIMSPLYTVFRFSDIDDSYYESYFKSSFWYRYMNSVANYGARFDRMNITNDDFFSMPLPSPPLPEQQKIAEILSTQDKVIDLIQNQIEELKKLKKAYLQKMFPQKGSLFPEIRFKGFTDAWEQRELGDMVDRVTRKNTYLESNLPLTISAQYGLIDQNEFFDKRIASKDVSGYFLLKKGEFAYNKSTSSDAPWGAVKRLDRYENGVLSTLYIVFALKENGNINSDFLVSYYDTDCWHKGIQAIAAEGARNHGLLNITPADYFKTTLNVPQNIEEQQQIGTYFRNLDNLITLHQRKLEQEQQKKKALMQLLLTGIVRVKI